MKPRAVSEPDVERGLDLGIRENRRGRSVRPGRKLEQGELRVLVSAARVHQDHALAVRRHRESRQAIGIIGELGGGDVARTIRELRSGLLRDHLVELEHAVGPIADEHRTIGKKDRGARRADLQELLNRGPRIFGRHGGRAMKDAKKREDRGGERDGKSTLHRGLLRVVGRETAGHSSTGLRVLARIETVELRVGSEGVLPVPIGGTPKAPGAAAENRS